MCEIEKRTWRTIAIFLCFISTISFAALGCLSWSILSGHHLSMASRAWMLLFLEAEMAGVSGIGMLGWSDPHGHSGSKQSENEKLIFSLLRENSHSGSKVLLQVHLHIILSQGRGWAGSSLSSPKRLSLYLLRTGPIILEQLRAASWCRTKPTSKQTFSR